MSCKSFGVSQVMVDLHRVGIIGLKDALQQTVDDGLTDREAVVNHLVELLAADNYIPDSRREAYHTALWREYLRFCGEDFSHLLPEVEVTVRGSEGEELDRFVELIGSVFGELELTPVITVVDPPAEGRSPQLVIGDGVVVAGLVSRPVFKTAVRKSFSDW